MGSPSARSSPMSVDNRAFERNEADGACATESHFAFGTVVDWAYVLQITKLVLNVLQEGGSEA